MAEFPRQVRRGLGLGQPPLEREGLRRARDLRQLKLTGELE